MKKDSIKKHLKPYSIVGRRKTTINHAFASALALNDDYDDEKLNEAIRVLGQFPDDHLNCVYCERDAETWDHIIGLVKESNFSGYGHQIRNLVPCCKDCNSKKGNKDWKQFLKEKVVDQDKREEIQKRLENYTGLLFKPLNSEDIRKKYPEDMKKYDELKGKIINLMEEADNIAKNIREKIKTNLI